MHNTLSYPRNYNNCRLESTFHSTTQISLFSPDTLISWRMSFHDSRSLVLEHPGSVRLVQPESDPGWRNLGHRQQQQPELHSKPPAFLCKQAYCTAEVIFTPVFTAHSSPLPFIYSVNISPADEPWNHPEAAAARERAVDGMDVSLLCSFLLKLCRTWVNVGHLRKHFAKYFKEYLPSLQFGGKEDIVFSTVVAKHTTCALSIRCEGH